MSEYICQPHQHRIHGSVFFLYILSIFPYIEERSDFKQNLVTNQRCSDFLVFYQDITKGLHHEQDLQDNNHSEFTRTEVVRSSVILKPVFIIHVFLERVFDFQTSIQTVFVKHFFRTKFSNHYSLGQDNTTFQFFHTQNFIDRSFALINSAGLCVPAKDDHGSGVNNDGYELRNFDCLGANDYSLRLLHDYSIDHQGFKFFSQETITNVQTSIVSVTQTVTSVSTTSVFLFSPKPTPTLDARDTELNDLRANADINACPGEEQIATRTLPASTTTSMSTVYFTPPAITHSQTSCILLNATRAVTSSQQVNMTTTSIVQAIVTSILDPTTVDSIVMQTSTETITATSLVAGPTQWCEMYLKASGGTVDGSYMSNYARQNVVVISSVESGFKDTWQVDSNGSIYPPGSALAGTSLYHIGGPYVYLSTAASAARNKGVPMSCQVDSDTLEVTCQYQSSSSQPMIWSNDVLHPVTPQGHDLLLSPTLSSGSTAFRLYAEPVNCVT
ncbi:hypothetical protein KCU65_g7728, partial [Aureobasidium melanogenum]